MNLNTENVTGHDQVNLDATNLQDCFDFLRNRDGFMIYDYNIINLLEQFNLKLVEVPDDGHCFVSCVRLFFAQFLNVQMTIQHVYDIVRAYNNNRNEELTFAGYGIDQVNFEVGSRNYFENGTFQNNFVDVLIGLASYIFKIQIIVLRSAQQNLILHGTDWPTIFSEHPQHKIYVYNEVRFDGHMNECSHYYLITGRHVQMRYSILHRMYFNALPLAILNNVDVAQPRLPDTNTHFVAPQVLIEDLSDSDVSVSSALSSSISTQNSRRRRRRRPLTIQGQNRRDIEDRQLRINRQTIVRENENEEHRQSRLNDQLNRTHQNREVESNEQTNSRMVNDAERIQNRRNNVLFPNQITVGSRYRHGFNQEDFDENDPRFAYMSLGPMNLACRHCGALHFRSEITDGDEDQFSLCCNKGKVSNIPAIREPPALLRDLYLGRHADDQAQRSFLNDIHRLNCSFALASAKFRKHTPANIGPPVVICHGEIRHMASNLEPEANVAPAFGQYLIYDSDQALNLRLENRFTNTCNPNVNRNFK